MHKPLILAVAVLSSAIGYFAYNLNQPVGPEKTDGSGEVMRLSDQQALSQKLGSVIQPQTEKGTVVTENGRTYVKGALPPGGDELVKEINTLKQEIENELTKDVPLPYSDEEMQKLIEETDQLIAEVDQKEGLKTAEFIDKMLNSPVVTTDPDLIELEKKNDQLDADIQKAMQSMQ